MVTRPPEGGAPTLVELAARALEKGALQPPADGSRAVTLVGCGEPGLRYELAIVDPDTSHRVPDGEIGEVWVAGPSVAAGYWQREGETRAVFEGRIVGEEESGCFVRSG